MKCTNDWQRQTLTRFLFAAESPLQEKPSEAVSGGFEGGSPRLRQKKSAVSHASEARVRGSKPSAGEAERSGKQGFGGGSPQLRQKKTKEISSVSRKRSERLRQISGGSGAAAPDYDKISSSA